MHPCSGSDLVGDLADALAPGQRGAVWIDGRLVERSTLLIDSGMRRGSTLSIVPPAQRLLDFADPPAALGYAVVAGPACTRWLPLSAGRHVVGRSSAAGIHVDDPTVELHHGRLEIGEQQPARFLQLTGRTPVTLHSAGSSTDADRGRGAVRVGSGSRLTIGRSEVALRSAAPAETGSEEHPRLAVLGSTVGAVGDPWGRIVRRGPSVPSLDAPPSLRVPTPPQGYRAPPAMGLIGAGIAAIGAGLMAAVLGQVLFAVFALVGAMGSLVTWATGAAVAFRRSRRAAAGYAAELEEFGIALAARRTEIEHRHRAEHSSVVDALDLAHREPGGLWSRRPSDGSLWAAIGRGDVSYPAPINAEDRRSLPPDHLARVDVGAVVADVSVPIGLHPGSTCALHGDLDLARSLARAIIVQVAAHYGPADVRLVVVTREPDRWSWIDWLPHAGRCIDANTAAHVEELRDLVDDGEQSRATVVVTDAADLLTARTGATRRMLVATRAACLVITAAEDTVPVVCDRVLGVGSTGQLRWRGDDGSEAGIYESTSARLAGITVETAAAAARSIAPLIDPENDDQMLGLPRAVALADLGMPMTSTQIVSRWRGNGVDPPLAATVGVTGDGTVEIDLVRDGPHALIAGTTGAGKSELLRTLIVALAARVSPDHVTFVLVDYKGGSTFDACARLPHVVGVVTDLDDGLAARALVSLDAEITRRERLLRSVGADELGGYRRTATAPLPRLVVVIDEFAGLARELPEFLAALVAIAQRGRSLGVHLLLATQRPAGVVDDDIRANTNLRLALRVQDVADARDVVGDDAPAAFARTIPGRAALRLGADELVVFQAASCTGPVRSQASGLRVERCRSAPPQRVGERGPMDSTELEVMVAAIADAALSGEVEAPYRPWIDPLPVCLTADLEHELGDAVGLVDDPARQCRRRLRWDDAAGNLLIIGSLGSGTTTAAIAVAAAIMRASSPADHHIYVVDGRGDRTWETVAKSEHCGALIAVHETERIMRLLRRLTDDIDRRAATSSTAPRTALLVDGLGPVRSALSEVGVGEGAAMLDRVIADGPAVGVVTCATTDGGSSRSLAIPAAHRWVFHVDDPAVARSAGWAGPIPSGDIPGRLRIVESGLEAQVRRDPALPDVLSGGPSRTTAGSRPSSVEVLPRRVDPESFDRQWSATVKTPVDDATTCLAVGIGADALDAVELRVPVGDHVFIGGAAGTGKSTALRQLAHAWRRVHPDGTVVALCPALAEGAALLVDAQVSRGGEPLLVVVDDADRVDDVDGALAALIARRERDVMVIAAARLEAVRIAYGHWAREVARSRCGLIMTSVGEVDGDLLGVVLPRRVLIPPRPGLAWAIDGSGQRLVQVAARDDLLR